MGDRGRKTAGELAETNGAAIDVTYEPPKAPKSLKAPAKKLWREIIVSRTPGFYGPGDLPLLEQYCYITMELIPKVRDRLDEKFSGDRFDTLNKTIARAEMLAKDLRICVSSRTRPDVKKDQGFMGSQTPYVE